MKREEALKEFIGYTTYDIQPSVEATKIAIKALEQEPCEDCISRQAVLDILKDKWNMFSDANDAMQESIDTIETIPSVNPQEPEAGQWIPVSERLPEEKFSDVIMEIQAGYLTNYCEGCPFYGIEEYEIKQRCDSVPVNCVWWWMHKYFKQAEQGEKEQGRK